MVSWCLSVITKHFIVKPLLFNIVHYSFLHINFFICFKPISSGFCVYFFHWISSVWKITLPKILVSNIYKSILMHLFSKICNSIYIFYVGIWWWTTQLFISNFWMWAKIQFDCENYQWRVAWLMDQTNNYWDNIHYHSITMV